ncbi:MAG: NAD(P)/FAD-dependent oxidoreductase, partial [Anaerolineae bacterium]
VYSGHTTAPGGRAGYNQASHYCELVLATTNILKIVPAFRGLHVIRTWVGTIDFTPDDNFIFGAAEGVEGLVLACGFSGHGFALTPIMGLLIREFILEGQTSLPVDAFRLGRFAEGRVRKAAHFAHQQLEGA